MTFETDSKIWRKLEIATHLRWTVYCRGKTGRKQRANFLMYLMLIRLWRSSG